MNLLVRIVCKFLNVHANLFDVSDCNLFSNEEIHSDYKKILSLDWCFLAVPKEEA